MSSQNISSKEALELLIEGNQRFASGLRSLETVFSVAKMKELAERGQTPFAIVLTCSDSRVPTEMVFDRGLGDLFVIRVAGNVISPSLIASAEFAALNFGSPIVVVMGHSSCGAIKAAISAEKDNAKAPTRNLEKLVTKIRPAVRWAMRHAENEDDLVSEATFCNVRRSVRLLRKRSPVIEQLTKENKLMVVGAVYDIETGRVTFTDQEAVAQDHVIRLAPLMKENEDSQLKGASR